MGTDIAATQAFQEKMFTRIREQMGDLLTDEDLKRLVESAMQKAFFEEVKHYDQWNRATVEPPVFVKAVKELTETRVRVAVSNWLEAHPEEVTKVIDECIARGIIGIVAHHFDSLLQEPMRVLAENLRQKGILG